MKSRDRSLLISALALASLSCAEVREPPPPSIRTLTATRMATDEEDLSVTVRFAGGHLDLRPAKEGLLYSARMQFDESRFEPLNQYVGDTRRLTIGIEARRRVTSSGRNPSPTQSLDLGVSPDVPTLLSLELGMAGVDLRLGGISLERLDLTSTAGESTVSFDAPNTIPCSSLTVKAGASALNMSGLGHSRCRNIEVKGGVGDMTLDFAGEWRQGESTTAEVKLGVGALTLRFPADLGVAIDVDRLVASIEAPGMVKRGDSLVSENYESADSHLKLRIATAFGDIKIVWIG